MGKTRPTMQPIQIPVMRGQIEMGENYACSVNIHSHIEWKCDHPFAVRFDWDAPFELHSKGKGSQTMRFKAGACLQPDHPYRYTIAVFAAGQVITTVAIIIVKPPKPDPGPQQRFFMPPMPGIIIVKPPRG
jgi:hypothetical protein